MLVVYFSHVLPALCPWRYLYALEQVSVSSWLDGSRLPHRYITSDMDVNEDCPTCVQSSTVETVSVNTGGYVLSKQIRVLKITVA